MIRLWNWRTVGKRRAFDAASWWWPRAVSQPPAAAGGNDISAAGSLSITGVADLNATGSLLAAGALSITGLADLDATGTLAAAGALSITGAVDLDAQGNLLAAGSLSISGAADLDAIGNMVAAGLLSISGSAELTSPGANDISATGELSITGLAVLSATGEMSASGLIAITGLADLDDGGAAPVVEVRQTPAGKAKRKRRYTVVIDDQEFEVSGYEQALELLERAKSLAETHAVDSAKRIEKRIRRRGKIGEAQVSAPTLSTPDTALKEIVSSYREQIRDIYLEAATAAELRELLRQKFAQEDEDDITVILLH